jgi:hypothetical protein
VSTLADNAGKECVGSAAVAASGPNQRYSGEPMQSMEIPDATHRECGTRQCVPQPQ